MEKSKKFGALILALAMLLTIAPATAPGTLAAVVDFGTCGDDLTWTLDDDGTLTISGTGEMEHYYVTLSSAAPWYASRTSIQTVVIASGVTSIGGMAFRDCTSLTNATIPDSVTYIGWESFYGCASLASVTIPDSVTSIDSWAFQGCESLAGITVHEDNPSYSSENGVLFNKDKTMLITYPGGKPGAYAVPDGVTYIAWESFVGCALLTGVTIPDSVTAIGGNAFAGCTSLVSVTIGNGVKTIGNNFAFNGLPNTAIVYVPNQTIKNLASGKGVTDERIIIVGSTPNAPSETDTETDEPTPTPTSSPDPHDGIDYTGGNIIVPGDVSGFEINLARETVTTPETYTTVVYSIDGGAKWKPVKSALSAAKFGALFSKDLTLWLSDKAIERATKQPPKDAAIVKFAKINARPKPQKLIANYEIAADKTGDTFGAWVLTEKGGTKAVKDGVEIGVAEGKAVDGQGYGKFQTDGGIAVTSVKKTAYFLRTAPKKDSNTYTAASKPKKISVSGAQKAPKFRVKAKTEKKNRDGSVKTPASAVIAVKAGTYVSINGGTPKLYTAKAEVDVLKVTGAVDLWMAATAKKPASVKQRITK